MDIRTIGGLMIVAGLMIAALGAILWFAGNTPGLQQLGRLPGDIRVEREGFRFYFPIMTSIILSIVLTAVLYLISRFR